MEQSVIRVSSFTHAVASATPHVTFLDSASLHPGYNSKAHPHAPYFQRRHAFCSSMFQTFKSFKQFKSFKSIPEIFNGLIVLNVLNSRYTVFFGCGFAALGLGGSFLGFSGDLRGLCSTHFSNHRGTEAQRVTRRSAPSRKLNPTQCPLAN